MHGVFLSSYPVKLETVKGKSLSMMMTELNYVLFQESPSSFRHTQAFVIIVECVILLLDNNLALHAFVPKSARMAALKRICSWSLGNELDHRRFPLLELPTLLLRGENQAGFVTGWRAVGHTANLETMIVVDRGDLQFNFASDLHVNWRG